MNKIKWYYNKYSASIEIIFQGCPLSPSSIIGTPGQRPARDLVVYWSKYIFTWNFQIVFVTTYLIFTIRSVSIKKIMETFGSHNGVATSLDEIVDDKKLRFTWFVINPGKHLRYIIERYYWKMNEKAIPFEVKKYKLCWLKNDL